MITADKTQCLRCSKCIKDCIGSLLVPDGEGYPVMPPENEKYCINCQHCLAVCPTGAISCNGVTASQCALPGSTPAPEDMLNLLRMRRSCRLYKDENVAPDIIEALKSSLAWTPTGCNNHKLYFSIIETKEEMTFFREKTFSMLKLLIKSGILGFFFPRFKRFFAAALAGKDVVYRNAPHMIIAATPKNAPCKEADPWIALSCFDLYAQSFGLGTCWCGFAVRAFKWSSAMKKQIQLPPNYKVGAVMLFGKPQLSYARATKPSNFNLEK